jgi:hypothetical protein
MPQDNQYLGARYQRAMGATEPESRGAEVTDGF